LRPREKILDADGFNKRTAAQTKLLCRKRDRMMMGNYPTGSAAFPGRRRASAADRGRQSIRAPADRPRVLGGESADIRQFPCRSAVRPLKRYCFVNFTQTSRADQKIAAVALYGAGH
jgi:hypothetical protein